MRGRFSTGFDVKVLRRTGFPKDQCQGLTAMDETLKDRDQTDDDILVFEVSDDALEAAAGPVGAFPTASIDIIPPNCC
jgi:hypothetical protein